MKTKITRVIALFLMAATQVATTFTVAEYGSTGVTPIFWTERGTALVLLGEENRSGEGRVWCDFFGKKDREDGNDPLVTAKRETWEESAHQLELTGDPLYHYQGNNASMVNFIWKVGYVRPEDIRKSADELRESGGEYHIEKTDWRWVKLEDLLDKTSGLKLHPLLEDKLEHPVMGQVFRSLVEKEPKSEEEATRLASNFKKEKLNIEKES